MDAYYEQDGITIYHGDCREVMPALDLKHISEVVADPPYGETSLKWDRWPDRWISVLSDHTPATCSLWCFGSLRMFMNHVDDFVFWKLAQEIVWEKHNGSGFFNDRFRRVHELAAHFYKRGTSWDEIYKSPQFTNDATARVVRKKAKPAQWQGAVGPTTYVSEDGGPRLMRSVIQVRSEHGRAVHPTQKPIGILEPIIEYSCKPGGTILSPFMGSGNDLLTAKLTGRGGIGIEIREEYCEAAAERLRQKVLFNTI